MRDNDNRQLRFRGPAEISRELDAMTPAQIHELVQVRAEQARHARETGERVRAHVAERDRQRGQFFRARGGR
jgi:hypothetical protein